MTDRRTDSGASAIGLHYVYLIGTETQKGVTTFNYTSSKRFCNQPTILPSTINTQDNFMNDIKC